MRGGEPHGPSAPPASAGERGLSLVELLAATTVLLMLSGGIFVLYFQSAHIFRAQELVTAAQQEGRGTLLIMSNDLLAAGCGVPVRLEDPAATDQNIGITAGTATSVTVRGCPTDPVVRTTSNGDVTVTAVPSSNVFPVASVTGFAVNNRVYVSSKLHWAYGTITSINTGTPSLTVNITSAVTPTFTLGAGSLVFREELLTLAYNAGSGVLQRSVTVQPAAAVVTDLGDTITALNFTYWDKTGAPLTSFPLSATARRAVHGIGINLTVRGRQVEFRSGAYATIQLDTAVQPRNLFAN